MWSGTLLLKNVAYWRPHLRLMLTPEHCLISGFEPCIHTCWLCALLPAYQSDCCASVHEAKNYKYFPRSRTMPISPSLSVTHY